MDASMFGIIGYVCFGIATVFFSASIYIFFKLKILDVINELNGKTAKRQIDEIRELNKSSKSKSYIPNIYNLENDQITKRINGTSRAYNPLKRELSDDMTEKLRDSRQIHSNVNKNIESTSNSSTSEIQIDGGHQMLTEILEDDFSYTILDGSTIKLDTYIDKYTEEELNFKIKRSDLIIHTDEYMDL